MFKKKDNFNIENIKIYDETFYCKICYSDCDIKEVMYLNCGHYFCRSCFKDYFEFKINNG